MIRLGEYSKKTVNKIFAVAIVFTAAVLGVCLIIRAPVPDALIYSLFGFLTGEAWALAGVTKTKVKEKDGAYSEGYDSESGR